MDTMKSHFLKALLRNVTISLILTPIIANARQLFDEFAYNLIHDNNFKVGFWSTVLIFLSLSGLVYALKIAGRNTRPELTSEPHLGLYDIGWPQHTALIGALLAPLILLSLAERHPNYIFVFFAVYAVLAAASWLWIRYASKKKYTLHRAMASDNLIRSFNTYRMIKACVCDEKLRGYISLNKFGVVGVWLALLFFPLALVIFLGDIVEGQLSVGTFFMIAYIFYFSQVSVRWVIYLAKGHSFWCSLRRSYCESI